MKLISIIPGFQPRTFPELLEKAEALKPRLFFTDHLPAGCFLNSSPLAPEALPGASLKAGDQLLLDFGRHLTGRLTLRLDSCGAHQDAPAFFRLDLAETPAELKEDPACYDGWLSRSWIQSEQLHVDLLPAEIALPRRYAFRYVRLTVLDTSPKYQLLLREAVCRAETSADRGLLLSEALHFPDDELRRIYEVSLNTLAECTQEVLEDGPKRDQRLWLGDLRLQALTSYISFRSLNLIKRCLYLFAGSRFPDGRMSANVFTRPAPEADDTWLLDYALLYPVTLREYLEQTDDAEALGDLLEPALEQVDDALARRVDGDGILTPEQKESCFIDWSGTLNRTASAQGVLICALDAAAALCEKAGNSSRCGLYRERAEALRRAAFDRFWSAEKGCFLSEGQISIHSQVWMALAGVMPEGRAGAAFETALSLPDAPRMLTPYMHHYYVTALLQSGLRDQAEQHLRAYWGGMVRAGADTFWECYDPCDPSSSPYGGLIVNSFCHAWSCTPAYLIAAYLL